MSKTKIKIKKFSLYAFVLFILVFVLWPVTWIATVAFRSTDEVFAGNPSWIPQTFTLENFILVFRDLNIQGVKFTQFALNSAFVCSVAVLISIAAALFGGYSLSRFKFKGRTIIVYTILITQLLPGIVYLLPFYTMMTSYHLLDTRLSLIVSYVIFSLPIATWMMYGFMEEVPTEVDQAAIIDGSGYTRILFQILTPVILPGLVSMALFSFILGWDDYLFASVLIKSFDKWTLPIGLRSLKGMYNVDWGGIIAYSLVISIPVVVLFLYLQRNIVQGLTSGSVKG